MKMRPSLLSSLLVTLLVVCGPDVVSASPKTSGTITGKMSVVCFLAASRTDSQVLKKEHSNAPDGITFYFVVARLPTASGLASLAEPRDFTVNGISYRKTTFASLSNYIEPVTVLDDLPDFLKQHPEFSGVNLPPSEQINSLTVTIAGSLLPDNGSGSITLELGWDNKYETFEFQFLVPKRKSP